MRVAHFCIVAPNACGLYHTAKDLVWGERQIGIDAQMINAGMSKNKEGKSKIFCGLYKEDGWLKTVEPSWAKEADILVLHSTIPTNFLNLGKPVVVVCHGRPESSFMLEHYEVMGVWTSYYTRSRSAKYSAYVTMWPEFMHTLGTLLPKDRLFCIPAPVNLQEFNPSGDIFDLGKKAGLPNILVADMWRYDATPFNVIQAVSLFQSKYCSNARVHIVGLPKIKSNHIGVLVHSLKEAGCLGNVAGGVRNIDAIYRSANLLVTPHIIATRTVREALACGLPIVAGQGCKYTPFTANPTDIEGFAKAINNCWKTIQSGKYGLEDAFAVAKTEFDVVKAAKAMKEIFDKVLKERESVYCRTWKNDDEYFSVQKSKYSYIKDSLDKWNKFYYENLKDRVQKYIGRSSKILCLGARQGTEVRAFRDLNCIAIGVDLEPGPENEYVMYGDFHNLKFSDNTFDIVFTNSLDHVKDLGKFLSEVRRVLVDGGRFILDINKESTSADKWASLFWHDINIVIPEIEKHGFRLQQNDEIEVKGLAEFTNTLIFSKHSSNYVEHSSNSVESCDSL